MKKVVLTLLLLLIAMPCRTLHAGDAKLGFGSYRIEGNTYTDTMDLVRAAYLELVELGKGKQRRAHAYDAAYSMQRFLKNNGYPDGEVTFEMEGDVAVFNVQEGRIAGLRHVRFEGVKSQSEATLREYFDFPGSGPLGNGPVLYPDARVDEAVAGVKGYYLSKGYYRVEMGEVRKERGEDETCMDLVVPLKEGPVYTVRRITLEGEDPPPLPTWIWQGKPFHGGVTAAIVSRTRDRVMNDGYPFARVDTEIDVDDEAAAVDIRVDVQRGELTRLDQVRFKGQRRTSASFMRRRIPMVQGQLLRKNAVRAAFSNLYSVGVFGRMDMDLEPTRPGYADMLFDVTETQSRQVDFGVGYGSWELFRGTVVYRDFNFLGRGLFFQARGVGAVRHQSLDLVLEDPWILGKQNVLTWKGGVVRREERYYTSRGYYTELFVERRLNDRVRLRAGYLFRTEEAVDISGTIPALDLREASSLSRSAGLWVNVRWDRRDHLFLPTTGWLAEGNLFWSTPALGANLDYLGLTLGASYFVPLGSGSVLAFGGQFASKEILNGDRTLPIQERFFLGGSESVRAYGQDQLTPIGLLGSGLGGLTALEGNIEWRKQIVDEFYGALFYDVGMVSVFSFDVDGAWGHGPGAGLRYYTPVGPVRVDVAYNPGPLYGASRRFQFFFSFGFSF